MTKTIVLLDVDGVLIHPRGYVAGVTAAVEYVIRRMGQPHLLAPQAKDILAFEARSITTEWDSTAICVAALFKQTPQFWQLSFNDALQSLAASGIRLAHVDYTELAHQCPPLSVGVPPALATLGTLFPQEPLFVELLGNSPEITAPMTRIFQNFVLGHERFTKTYGLEPLFLTESLLETLDSNLLSPESRQRLQSTQDVYPIIYTARPSLPPSFVKDLQGYAPEAEIAWQQLAFEGVPLIGYGRMRWLAQQEGVHSSSYVKPSPVQALTAIFSALLHQAPDGERRAFNLALAKEPIPAEIKDSPWRVIVCEDSTGGIRGVREAVAQLAGVHEVSMTAVGVATAAENVAALQKVADHVVADVNTGLAWALGW